MRLILDYVGGGQYKTMNDSDEYMLNLLERTLESVKLLEGYPWEMKTQPKKIIFVVEDTRGIINFVT